MTDKQIEMQWDASSTATPAPTSIPARTMFIKLKVVMTAPLHEDEEEYELEIERMKSLGISDKPDLPESLKPTLSDRYFNTSHFEVISWTAIWADEFDCEMIVAELYFPKLRITDTINAIYTEKEWIEILNQLGYEC